MSESGFHAAASSLPKIMLPAGPSAKRDNLSDLLRRCPLATVQAARRFRLSRDEAEVPTIVNGVISRYQERNQVNLLEQPKDSLRLVEDLGLDSLTMIEISMTLEDVLEVSLSDEKLRQLRTLGDIKGCPRSC